jgi:hypothetical protein
MIGFSSSGFPYFLLHVIKSISISLESLSNFPLLHDLELVIQLLVEQMIDASPWQKSITQLIKIFG